MHKDTTKYTHTHITHHTCMYTPTPQTPYIHCKTHTWYTYKSCTTQACPQTQATHTINHTWTCTHITPQHTHHTHTTHSVFPVLAPSSLITSPKLGRPAPMFTTLLEEKSTPLSTHDLWCFSSLKLMQETKCRLIKRLKFYLNSDTGCPGTQHEWPWTQFLCLLIDMTLSSTYIPGPVEGPNSMTNTKELWKICNTIKTCCAEFISFLRQISQSINSILFPKRFLGLTVKEGIGSWQNPLSHLLKDLPALRKSPMWALPPGAGPRKGCCHSSHR